MNTFTQHVPAFCDIGTDPLTFRFNTTEELLSHEYLKRFANHKGFTHFAKSDNKIMSISDDGYEWWVVGRVEDPATVNLPHGKAQNTGNPCYTSTSQRRMTNSKN